ncbi:hypothetical protein B296_00029853 [Ensete ventricosum]|uniref:Uncharacterized protein n=1 Tax=Ensete ventricosum TaxID=4639 RepID=A0A426YCK9_ENSVE|nr:hypothetical protein B296_00029853 [Ensete ventricosum]
MPCLNLSTNVSLDGVDTSAILSEASKTVARLIGKPEAVRPASPTTLFAGSRCHLPGHKMFDEMLIWCLVIGSM